ncbi:MAG: type II secretion system protein GspM [Myxococcota bacterium]
MNDFWSRVTAAFSNLSARERALVSAAGILVGIAVVYVAVVVPILGVSDRASSRLQAAETNYEVMKRLRADYDDVRKRLVGVENRIQPGARGSLRTTLESLAVRSQVAVESMEPQAAPTSDRYRETKVEVGLKGVTLPQTVAYLHQIESADQLLAIKSLKIRTRPDKPELLDVTFTVSSFERI